MATTIGTRVKLIQPVENYPTVLALPGLTGTLVRIDDDGAYWIRLDQWLPELNEWNNELQIWDWSPENEGRFHPEAFFTAIS